MFTKLIDALKATRRTIVFTEGPDARILEAADRLIKDDLMNVILIGNVDEVKAAAEKGGFDIAKAEIIDPATYAGMDEMVAKMVELRKGKGLNAPMAEQQLEDSVVLATMMLALDEVDGLVSGACHSTAEPIPASRIGGRSAVATSRTSWNNWAISFFMLPRRSRRPSWASA